MFVEEELSNFKLITFKIKREKIFPSFLNLTIQKSNC